MRATRSSPVAQEKARDAERSKQAILQAARDEFAQHGLAGARMDRIATRAALDKRLIYYYFTNKDALFLAALEAAYSHIRSAEQKLNLQALEPVSAIRTLTEFTWGYYLAHPEFLTLLNSENIDNGKHLAHSTHIRQTNMPLIDTLREVLARGHSQGVFRAGVDAVQLYMSIAGLAYFYLNNRHTLSAAFGRDLMTPAALAQRKAHVCEVILGYVTLR